VVLLRAIQRHVRRTPTPQYTSWQDQEPTTPHQLAFSANDGGFVSSQYDEGLPAKFKNDVGSERGMNNLKLCTPTGNAVVVSALRDGTFAYFEDERVWYAGHKCQYLSL